MKNNNVYIEVEKFKNKKKVSNRSDAKIRKRMLMDLRLFCFSKKVNPQTTFLTKKM
ncbi:MAG: hypothetical protein PUB18_04435 [bacterium]|nr:hypothetical protein [bacterium]